MGRIILFTSGKGGSGKSAVVSQLGVYLSKFKKRVLITELTPPGGSVAHMLGIADKLLYDLGDVYEGNCNLRDAVMSCEEYPNLYLLPPPCRQDLYDMQAFRHVLSDVAGSFDYILIESGAYIASLTPLFPMIDSVVIVTTPDILSVGLNEKLVDFLYKNNIRSINCIVNMLTGNFRWVGMIPHLDCIIDGIGVPLLGIVPHDEEFQAACMRGTQADSLTEPFSRIARRLMGEFVELFIS